MRGDILVNTQLMMAQAIRALAEHVEQSTGYNLTPVTVAELPTTFGIGTIACITDSTVNTWGGVVAGGGTFTVLAWFDGANWKVMAA
jgi:hypothetical protein